MNALVCVICGSTDALALTVPEGPDGATPFTQLIDRFRAQVPMDLPGAGIDVTSVTPVGEPVAHSLSVTVTASAPLSKPDVFPEAPEGYSFGKPEVTLAPDRRSATLIIPASLPKDGALAGLPVTLTAVDGDRFVERERTVSLAGDAGTIPETDGIAGLGHDAGLCLSGGLILNLMPRAPPVPSIKLLGAISTVARTRVSSDADPGTAAGIVVLPGTRRRHRRKGGRARGWVGHPVPATAVLDRACDHCGRLRRQSLGFV